MTPTKLPWSGPGFIAAAFSAGALLLITPYLAAPLRRGLDADLNPRLVEQATDLPFQVAAALVGALVGAVVLLLAWLLARRRIHARRWFVALAAALPSLATVSFTAVALLPFGGATRWSDLLNPADVVLLIAQAGCLAIAARVYLTVMAKTAKPAP